MNNNKYFLTKSDFENKTVFWDIDGTLAPYRFNGKITAQPDDDHIKNIENGIFLERPPSKLMTRILNNIPSKQNIILGHSCCQKEIDDKTIWVDKHFSNIDDAIFVTYPESKAKAIIAYCVNKNIPISNCLFIDDDPRNLAPALNAGISSWHVSSLIDYFE